MSRFPVIRFSKLANFACKRPFCRSVFAEWPGMTSYFLVRFYLKTVKKTELLWTYGTDATCEPHDRYEADRRTSNGAACRFLQSSVLRRHLDPQYSAIKIEIDRDRARIRSILQPR